MVERNGIERIDELRLSKADSREISALLDESFGGEFEGRSFFIQRNHLRLVKRVSGRIVGHLALVYRAIRIGENLVTIMGIGDVAVAKEARRQGIGAVLVDAAIAEAKQSKALFLLLFGEAKIYGRAGFESATNPLVWVEHTDFHSTSITRKPSESLMIYQLGTKNWDQSAEVDFLGGLF